MKITHFIRNFLLIIVVIVCVLLSIKQKNMTYRQSFLKLVYPVLMLKGKYMPFKKDMAVNNNNIKPVNDFFSLYAVTNHGDTLQFNNLRNKKILIVNTASDCGYTAQYEQLETLQKKYTNLVILGFPANDFKEQEAKDDAAIEQFCKINYGVSFTIMKKSIVVKSANQNLVFNWLSDGTKNGWNNQAPTWNFNKYLIDENGVLAGYFSQVISPLDKKITELIEK